VEEHEVEKVRALGATPEQVEAFKAHGLNFGQMFRLVQALLKALEESGVLRGRATPPEGQDPPKE
jgi:hypothetical protein